MPYFCITIYNNLSRNYNIFNWIFILGRIEVPINPCTPSPCGPYSICRETQGHAVCSCQEQYIGSPPSCRPECMVSSECLPNKACVNSRCVDPCIGACGLNALCNVVNHNSLCSCPNDHVGDPFVQCIYKESKSTFNTANAGLIRITKIL